MRGRRQDAAVTVCAKVALGSKAPLLLLFGGLEVAPCVIMLYNSRKGLVCPQSMLIVTMGRDRMINDLSVIQSLSPTKQNFLGLKENEFD